MNRNLKVSQIFGQFYVAFVFCFIVFMYFDICHIFKPNLFQWHDKTLANIYFIFFNILFVMLVWCLIRTMISDPGKIPPCWGLYLDDPEHKKRRYCLICHIFKPERCHHCSICGRCVLNMDHHCPWLNNCIGFMNRKFFLLLIFYVNVIVWYIIGGFLPFVYEAINGIWNSPQGFQGDNLFVLIPFMIFLPFSFIIFKFFHFHLNLISRNMTTLEHMDRERNKEPLDTPSNFDIGLTHNWHQVFGRSMLLWPFPIFGESGKPIGEGVTFKHRTDFLAELEKKEKVTTTTSKQQPTESCDTEQNLTNQNANGQLLQKNVIPPQFRAPSHNPSLSQQRLHSSQVSEPLDTRQSYQANYFPIESSGHNPRFTVNNNSTPSNLNQNYLQSAAKLI